MKSLEKFLAISKYFFCKRILEIIRSEVITLFNRRHFVYPNVTFLSLLFIILFFFFNFSMSRRVKEGRRV